MNIAIWWFSFRYWNIAHVMPIQLAGKQPSFIYTAISWILFLGGSFINIVAPIMYSYYSITANNVDTTPQERDEIWEEYHFRLYFFRYTIGLT